MLVKPPRDDSHKPFRIIPEPTKGDQLITYLQVALIFVVVRLVMVVGGVTFVRIPLLDPLLRSIVGLMRHWFDR